MELATVKQALADLFSGVDGVNAAFPYEPRQLDPPAMTVMTGGFRRRSLATNEVQSPIVDPLGGRTWVWIFNARLWVSMKTDEREAQEQMDLLEKRVVEAVDRDQSLGGLVTDTAVSSGLNGVVTDQAGNPLLVADLALEVEWTESA